MSGFFRRCMYTDLRPICSFVGNFSALGCGEAAVYVEPEVGSDSEEER